MLIEKLNLTGVATRACIAIAGWFLIFNEVSSGCVVHHIKRMFQSCREDQTIFCSGTGIKKFVAAAKFSTRRLTIISAKFHAKTICNRACKKAAAKPFSIRAE
jgi:hypothetical protein